MNANRHRPHQTQLRYGQTIHDVVRNPHNVSLPHEKLHGAFGSVKQSRVAVPHRLHGRAFQDKMPLIIDTLQAAPLTQALFPCDPSAPAHDNRQRVSPIFLLVWQKPR